MRGIRLRWAASASRARVSSFSLTSSSSRAACHSSGDTIGGVFIGSVLLQIVVGDVEQTPPEGALAIHPVGCLAEHRGNSVRGRLNRERSNMPYEVPPLPYDYDALEPHIDEATMRVHHDK